ncbi:MAG: haloacid dehalogenase [Vulcanimicrobiota bacterium]
MSTSKQLDEIAQRISARFERIDQARDQGIHLHRKVIKASSLAIRAIHRREFDEAEKNLTQAQELLQQACKALEDYPSIFHAGFLQDAQKEYAEARITQAVICGRPLPEPEQLEVDFPPFLNGLAEAVGELRRHILDRIRLGQLEEAERVLAVMDDIYYTLITMDFPDAITKGLRRSTDVARGCLERTRGDLTNHFGRRKIDAGIEFIKARLDEREISKV